MERILAINPGSTSTKIAVYDDETPVFVKVIDHSKEELAPFAEIFDQYEYRKDLVLKTMEEQGVDRKTLTAVVSRGGLLPPVPAGAFEVNDTWSGSSTTARKMSTPPTWARPWPRPSRTSWA